MGDRRYAIGDRRWAIIAVIALALGGCALLVAAALSFRSDQSAVSAQLPTPTRTPPAITSVPTFIPSETPTPTETPSATPTRSATPSPTASATPATPSRTPTRTRQPTGGTAPTSRPPTATLTATSPPAVVSGGGSHGVTGQLSLCNPKPSYAAKSDTFIGERICVNELITNTTDQTIPYGILGVNAENLSGGASAFQTSWRGDLSLPPHGNGPGGGNWQDGLYLDVGTYSLTLSICYSDVDTCLGSGGEWETLTPGITINVVAWTP